MDGWSVFGTNLSDESKILGREFMVESPTIFVLGNEGEGLSKAVADVCDAHFVIGGQEKPKSSFGYDLDSLNVSVATGVLLHALKR